MTVQRRPAAEVDIDDALVGAVLADQHPDLADRTLRLLGSGWDNVLYRLDSADAPGYGELGLRTLAAVLADAPGTGLRSPTDAEGHS